MHWIIRLLAWLTGGWWVLRTNNKKWCRSAEMTSAAGAATPFLRGKDAWEQYLVLEVVNIKKSETAYAACIPQKFCGERIPWPRCLMLVCVGQPLQRNTLVRFGVGNLPADFFVISERRCFAMKACEYRVCRDEGSRKTIYVDVDKKRKLLSEPRYHIHV